MSLEEQIKKLRGRSLFETIYNRHKQRRHRNKSISLQRVRELTLSEYYLIRQQLKILGKEDITACSEERPTTIPDATINKEEDYYIVVGGKSMLNSTWRRMIEKQREAGTSPTPSPDQQLQRYLLSLFKNDK